jgi:hypothetical protein
MFRSDNKLDKANNREVSEWVMEVPSDHSNTALLIEKVRKLAVKTILKTLKSKLREHTGTGFQRIRDRMVVMRTITKTKSEAASSWSQQE